VLFSGVREVVQAEALAVWTWYFAQDPAVLADQRVCYTAEQFACRTFFTFNYGQMELVKRVPAGTRPPETLTHAWALLDSTDDEDGLRGSVQAVTELSPGVVQKIAEWQSDMHKRALSKATKYMERSLSLLP
jgi:hypothetical protein